MWRLLHGFYRRATKRGSPANFKKAKPLGRAGNEVFPLLAVCKLTEMQPHPNFISNDPLSTSSAVRSQLDTSGVPIDGKDSPPCFVQVLELFGKPRVMATNSGGSPSSPPAAH